MIQQIIITLLLFCGFLGIIFLSEYLRKRFGFETEVTRKLAHVTATLSSLVFVFTIDSHWYIFVLGILFFLLLFIGKKMGVFNSIDAIQRKSSGSYLLPVAIYLSFLFYNVFENSLYYILPILLLAISDATAGFVGIRFEKHTSRIKLFNWELQKTYLGSFAFFTSALIISLTVLHFYDYNTKAWLMWAFLIALINTIIELLSSRGLDNITIPLITIFMIWLSIQ